MNLSSSLEPRSPTYHRRNLTSSCRTSLLRAESLTTIGLEQQVVEHHILELGLEHRVFQTLKLFYRNSSWGWNQNGQVGLGTIEDSLKRSHVPEKASIINGEKMILVPCDFKDHLVPHKLEALHGQFISHVDGGTL
ncbi:unnamed protein product [Lactuca virosa]|uniref:Uncharacterized protein n=1 Tax=Lactuca virosa TaxID=75947 RepID=A0AAU9PPT5_9ASTR|nr:unnamed protein product [Lactuca virosa]